MEIKYAKIEGGYLKYPPHTYENVINYQINEVRLIQDGYKPIVENPYPLTGKEYSCSYIDTPTTIEQIWVEQIPRIDVASIDELKRQLLDLDYLTLKNIEAERCGKELPKQWSEIDRLKQPLRDRIKELERK